MNGDLMIISTSVARPNGEPRGEWNTQQLLYPNCFETHQQKIKSEDFHDLNKCHNFKFFFPEIEKELKIFVLINQFNIILLTRTREIRERKHYLIIF